MLYTYMFVSRNKDNVGLEGFKPRRAFKLCKTNKDFEDMIHEFEYFVASGVPNEVTRLYRSVNARDEEKLKRNFISRIIKENVPIEKYNAVLVSEAQKKECRSENKWLFDFDSNDYEMLLSFIEDIKKYLNKEQIHFSKTPNGFAIVVNQGFDTRELLEKYSFVTLKRDDFLFITGWQNPYASA